MSNKSAILATESHQLVIALEHNIKEIHVDGFISVSKDFQPIHVVAFLSIRPTSYGVS
jgi:hypothetical protein